MPSAVITTDELANFALASDKKMGRYFDCANGLEVGMGIPVKLVGKKCLYLIASIHPGGQANGVHHD